MQEEDYTSELITKWSATGHLTNVREDDRTRVAQRLEAAHRRSMGQHGDAAAIVRELSKLQKEGYLGPSGQQENVRVRSVRRKGRNARDRGVCVPGMA